MGNRLKSLLKDEAIDINACKVNDLAVLQIFLWEVEHGEETKRWN